MVELDLQVVKVQEDIEILMAKKLLVEAHHLKAP